MKKLFFLIFFSINILTFGSNVYFLNDGDGYIYTNGQTFYSDSLGRALIAYHLWADPTKYIIDEWGARFQDTDGNWSDWSALSSSYGGHQCLKAGTWHVQGRVHVDNDIYGYSDYYMETSFTLYFYVVDNYAPSIPQNLTVGSNPGDDLVRLQWIANTESDMDSYEVSRKLYTNNWVVIGNTTNNYFVDTDWYIMGWSTIHMYYKIRASDINNNYSGYSNVVDCWPYPAKKNPTDTSNVVYQNYLDYRISNNYPNPFNPTTNIVYQLKDKGLVSLKVYNILGQEVANLVNEEKGTGTYKVEFNGANLPSGIYIYSLKVNDFTAIKKMSLMK
ncbi:MAG: T9SS type A sorting domain-containing protein [Ignavibacteria bacterium]|jgi:hypothetical protein